MIDVLDNIMMRIEWDRDRDRSRNRDRDRSRNRDRDRSRNRDRDRSRNRDRDRNRKIRNYRGVDNNNNHYNDNKDYYSLASASSSSSTRSSEIDDSIGHYSGHVGDVIMGRYTIEKELGTGTFGKVYYCKDSKHNDHIALKIVRSIEKYIKSAKIEAKILGTVYSKMKEFNSNTCMKMYSHFSHDGHYFMVCEPLGKSLYEYIKQNDYVGFPLNYVRDISRQLLEAMNFLKTMCLVHTDLKLENVLFVSDGFYETTVSFKGRSRRITLPTSSKIKLIDFGGATFDDDESKGTIINTRQYRSPEVTLELGWSYPSDIWSVGCIVAEIYSGDLLFPAHEEVEHLAMIEKCIGEIPLYMSERSVCFHEYFHSDGKLRTEKLSSDSRKAVRDIIKLKDYFTLAPRDSSSGIIELMEKLLIIDPDYRIDARNALHLSFLTSSSS